MVGAERPAPRALIPPDFIEYVRGLHVNWVGISVALHVEHSTDGSVERSYSEAVETATFSDAALRQMIREFTEHGFNVYLTLAFEIGEAERHAERPVQRFQLGDPGHPETGVPIDHQHCPECAPPIKPEFWPWSPSHPDHDGFVAEFWRSYAEQAVHFAGIAQEEGVKMYSLGTETDRLFRTRSGGDYFRNDFRQELASLVAGVRSRFSGLLTYDMNHFAITDADRFFEPGSRFLWEDLDLDVVGISAWFPLAESSPTTVMSVAALRREYERLFNDYLVPLQAENVGRPIVFLEYGARDVVGTPASPADYEPLRYVFSDRNGNGIDDGEETQANIFKALFAAMDEHPGVLHGAFFWDNWIIDDQEWRDNWLGWRRHNFRGKLAEGVVRDRYSCWSTNRSPEPVGTLRPLTIAVEGPGVTVEVSGAFRDPDGDRLVFEASSSAPSVAAVVLSGSRVTVAPVAQGTAEVTVTATDISGSNGTAAQAFGVTVVDAVVHAPFTDHPLVPGETPIKAVHFVELRARIDALRREAGLARFRWTDPELRAGLTPVRLVHLLELRSALDEAYGVAGRPAPRWTDGAPVSGVTPIRAAHLMELRAAMVALE